MEPLDELKLIIREKDIPFFSDEELNYYLNKNNGSVRSTAYDCLIIKAENTSLIVDGITTEDTSKYFRRLASRYKPNNSGTLRGGN